jgi:hypothetical protein
MLSLRPLLVVTGSVHVEGGDEWESRQRPAGSGRRKEHVTVTIDRTITGDRRNANVIYLDFYRRLRKIQLCRTPFGALLDTTSKANLLRILDLMDRKIAAFNATAKTCQLTNCVVWERLAGNRQAGVAGWLARRARKDGEWRSLARQLDEDAAA